MKIYRNFIVYYMQNTGFGKRKWRLLCVWTSKRRTPFSQRVTPTVPLTSHIGFDQEETSVNSERDWWMEPWTFEMILKTYKKCGFGFISKQHQFSWISEPNQPNKYQNTDYCSPAELYFWYKHHLQDIGCR